MNNEDKRAEVVNSKGQSINDVKIFAKRREWVRVGEKKNCNSSKVPYFYYVSNIFHLL